MKVYHNFKRNGVIYLSLSFGDIHIYAFTKMTILPKKKSPNQTEENGDGSHPNTHNHSGHLNSIPSYSQNRERSLDDCYSSGGVTVELDPLENDGAIRRIRSSPSRTTRISKIRGERGVGPSWANSPKHAPNYARERSPDYSANSSPKPGPSNVADEECNSEDEYVERKPAYTEHEWTERDRLFEKWMAKCGFVVRKMKEDGACLFRSVSDQVYGDQEMHDVVRKHCMDYIAANRDYYSQYMTEDFNKYINRKRKDCTHGNHIEIQAMCEMYNRPIEVFCYSKDPINIFHDPSKSDNVNEPIRLSYQRDSHYNSVVNPYKATVGVGLGLPNHSPGSADRNLVKDAVRQSEQLEIEQTMLEDKLRATDWEATNEAIEEQVARESYLQWFKDNEARKKSMGSQSPKDTPRASSTCSGNNEGDGFTVDSKRKEDDGKKCETSDTRNNKSSENIDFNKKKDASYFRDFPPEYLGTSSDRVLLADIYRGNVVFVTYQSVTRSHLLFI